MNSINIRLKSVLTVLALSFAVLSTSAKDVLYVKSGASGDGSSWSKAFGNIQQAVDSAAKRGADVWVAKGTYTSEASSVVSLKPNVSLYGGFSGTETSLAARDTAKNPTILDGKGKVRVVYQDSEFTEANAVVVDGFTIQNGSAVDGAGAYLMMNATLNNCIVKNNIATGSSSAIYAKNSKVKNCIICNNGNSSAGRNMYLNSSEMDSCVVKNNTASYSSAGYFTSNSYITNTHFDANINSASINYGPVYLNNSKMDNCKVTNSVGQNSGLQAYGYCVISNCSFSGNVSTAASVIHVERTSEILDCEIFDNEAYTSGVVDIHNGSSMKRCKVYNNVMKNNHCIVYIRTSSTLSNSLIYGNSNNASSSYAPLMLSDKSSMINTTFVDNETGYSAALNSQNSEVINSIVLGTKFNNTFKSYCELKETTFTNCMIEGGVAGEGNISGTKELASFVDAENGDYSLSETSYCINAGTDVEETIDLLGKARKQSKAVDMGAIESKFEKNALPSIGEILYVKEGSKGDGTSWKSAFGDINEAIKLASRDGKKHQIWVAAGTYFGDTTTSSPVLCLEKGIDLYGGFAGSETSLAKRDTAKNPTVIDGKKARRVISQNYDFDDAMAVVVDGFTIQNGSAVDGGGVYILKNATINNCIIKGNSASGYGSAVYAIGASIKKSQIIGNTYLDRLYYTVRLNNAVMDSCVVKNNKCYYNGAIYAEMGSEVSNCEISANSSYSSNTSYRGSYFSASKVNNCKFVNTDGAGSSVELRSATEMRDCLFEGNKNVGTHTIYVSDKNSLVDGCQIINNSTNSPLLYAYSNSNCCRCIIKGNTTSSYMIESYSSVVSNSLLCDNVLTSTNSPIYLSNASMINCTVVGNDSKCSNFINMTNSTLKNSIIVGNKTNAEYSNNLSLSGTNTIVNNMFDATYVVGNLDGSMKYAAFTDPENGDYSLSKNSYCINAGVDTDYSFDLMNKDRKQGGAVDMGAIESDYDKAPVITCGDTLYVKAGSNGNGSSWKSAFGDIQEAIFAASKDGKKHQIWVAAGTYYGDSARHSVVNLASGISLYGGFAGDETSLAKRDTAKNPTIIDGKNLRRGITQNYVFSDSMSVVVDGFTIQNGAMANGAGAYINANTTITNCIFRNNKASNYAMAVYAINKATIKNSLIIGNSYSSSGRRTVVLENSTMDSCVLKNNSAYEHCCVYAEKESVVKSCVFEGNTNKYTDYRGSYFGSSTVTDCQFINMTGGSSTSADNSVVKKCLFKGSKSNGTTLLSVSGSKVEDCSILNNNVRSTLLYGSNKSEFRRIRINGNSIETRMIELNNSTLLNSEICNNTSTYSYEPIYLSQSTLENNTFVNNTTKSSCFVNMNNSSKLKNVIIVGNEYEKGYSNHLSFSGNGNVVSYSMIEGGASGEGNVDGSMAHAAFTDPENGDYSLSEKSYCINAGADVADEFDLLGNARKQGDAVDMGAIESAHKERPSFVKCGDIIYVKAGSEGDGSSWKSAFGDIQQAIFEASADGKKHQIWVAAGTYYGDTTLSTVVNLTNGISLYGGFAGSETSLAARDTAKNPTIIDGMGKRRGISQSFGFADSMAVVIDGFTIQNGYAVNGGGAYLRKNTTLNNCIVKACHTSENGIAIYSIGTNIANCVICDNGDLASGANKIATLYMTGGKADSCIIKNNKAYSTSSIFATDSVRITNCLIEENESASHHTMSLNKYTSMSDCKIINNINKKNNDYTIYMGENVVVDRCLFDGNESNKYVLHLNNSSVISNSQITNNKSRGSYLMEIESKSKIINCTIADNVSNYQTVYCYSGTQILNSIIVGNKRTNNSESIYVNGATITYSMIEGGANGDGNIDGSKSSAAFKNPSKGDYSLSGTSLCINAGTDVADSLDLLGNERKQSDAVDMGAIESEYSERASVGNIIYVKAGAEGKGLSWDDAFGEINKAIALASTTGKRHQIWVAKGTYLGDTTLVSAISLSAGVSLYGGFAGTESSLDERDVEKNVTVIDGKYKRRCIVQNYDFVDSMAVTVDGFTVQNGSLSSNNGVNARTKKNTTFVNCIFRNAKTGYEGVYAEKSAFVNCTFADNMIQDLQISEGVVDSCTFTGNTTTQYERSIVMTKSVMSNSQIYGNTVTYGAVEADNSSLTRCKVYNNQTNSQNTIYLSNSTLDNSLVYGNVIKNSSHSIISADYNSFITNSTIAHNTTKDRSAISYMNSSSKKFATVANSIIYGNKVTDDVRPQVVVSDYVKVKYCASDGDLTGEHNIKLATANSGSDTSKNYVCFINAAGGDYRLHATSSCIDMGLDSVMSGKMDINGGARIYGKAIDLGAAEFDGEYVQMLDYSQVVCYNRSSDEATFDSTIAKLDWKIVYAGHVAGFETPSGTGATIPSMKLTTKKTDVDTLSLMVTPYDKAGVAGVSFNYNYYVYPDFSAKKVTFARPKKAYEINVTSNNITIEWNKLSLPVDVDKYDFYVWKASQKMPVIPTGSYVKDHSKYLSDLDNHTTYKYMVKAIVACDTISSDVDSFRIDIPVSLEIEGSTVCELGTKLNSSTSSRRYVKGFELTDSISYTLSGADAADFSVKLRDGWNKLTGGSYEVYYNPTDSKKSSSTATLTFKSGKYTAVMYLKGILANYYVFDALVENEVYKAGDTIPIKGFVTDAYGNPFEGKRLKVSLRKGGSEIKTFEATSNAKGEVTVKYESSLFESGVYTVGVCLSGESSNATFDGFDIPGISCNVGTDRWLVQKGDTVRGTVTVRNRSNVESKNVKVKTLTLADGLKVEFDSIDVLYGLESKKINYYITGVSLTEGSKFLPSTFRVETAEGLTADFASYFYCEMPYGQIKVLPANIKEYVSKQKPKTLELSLINTGFGETGKVSVALPKGFEGLSMPNGTEIESIKSGDTVKTVLKLAYYDGAKLNTPINGSIGFNCENGKSTSISYTMEYTSSLVGSVVVDVVDEYYYNSASKSHLAGATVEIKNAFNSKVIASGISDSTGKVKFDSIPEGDYLLCVRADKHSSYKETVSVQAGQTLNKFVFITYQAVTYTWNVERVEIEDKYEIEIEAEYETNVPVPVVTAEFPNGLPSRESFNPGDKQIAYLVITNHGLIAAKSVVVNVPTMKHFKFTPDVDHIDSLPASTSVVVPVTIERAGRDGKFDDPEDPDCKDCPKEDPKDDDDDDPQCKDCPKDDPDDDDDDDNPDDDDDDDPKDDDDDPKDDDDDPKDDDDDDDPKDDDDDDPKDDDDDDDPKDDDDDDDPKDDDDDDPKDDDDDDDPKDDDDDDDPKDDPKDDDPTKPGDDPDDTGGDCQIIIVKYGYECGEFVEKETYVKTWKCITSSPTGTGVISGGGGIGGGYGYGGGFGGGYGGSVNIGVSTVKTKNCDEEESCWDQIDGWKSCLWDLIGWIPALGDVAEGVYREKKLVEESSELWEAAKDLHKIITDVHDAVDKVQNGIDITKDVVDYAFNGIEGRDVAKYAYQFTTTQIGLIPGLGDIPFGCFDWICQGLSCLINDRFAANCGQFQYDVQKRIQDSLMSVIDKVVNSKLKAADVDKETVDFYEVANPYMLASHDIIEYASFEVYKKRMLLSIVGSDEALWTNGIRDYLDYAMDSITAGKKINIDTVKTIPVSDLSLTDMIAISERWNKSMDAWQDSVYESNEQYPNIINKEEYYTHLDNIANFYQYVLFRGFNNVDEMLLFINDEMAKHNKKRKSVCASVKLHISQTLTMTREAFDGTLTVNNGNETMDMDNFRVVLDIRDDKGNDATDLFQINTQSLTGVASVDGTSSIGAGREATAVFRFIPERGAAPKEPVNYSFGGKIIYVENGDTITMDLDPVTLTVNPSPNLQIDYFMQRNILGDDALTEDRVEPSVPAALGVRIDNQGYGDAKNVKLETAQPEIVDNNKGLLIDFAIIGSSLNGKDCDLGSENIDFGTIEAQSAKTGVWWLTSSLLGHFTKYEASVVHANSFGNPELSLVSGIAIHELIKTVDAYGVKDDHVVDFLVNDYEDDNDTPDAIYYSDGGKDTVKLAKKAAVDKPVVGLSDSIITLTVTPSEAGWNYAQLADPGDNFYEIQKVVRVKDSVEIPLSNVWTTFVSLPDGKEPIYENRLHFLDYMTTLGENDYDIYYSIRKNILKVTEIVGTPEEEKTVTTPIDSVVVKFNRKIQKESFDYNDIELYCQAGDNLSDSTITIKQIDDLTYVVNISSKTKTSGFYKLEVNVNEIFDETGYAGEFGKGVAWNQFIEEKTGEISPIVEFKNDDIMVYAFENCIYVKSTKAGSLDVYDILSRIVVKNAQYGEGVTQVATLPRGVYLINGNKVIVK